jgi:arylsulfatase A-like enzyme
MLLWLKSLHALGQRDPEFRRALPDEVTLADVTQLARKSVEAYRNNYRNGARQADWVLMQIWTWLETNGYLENSVIVITGDHGESLGEHGRLGHGRSLQNSELQVPLWIYEPSGRLPTRDFVFQTDIAPTILDLIALPIPASWEGSSMLGKPPNEWNAIYLMNGGSQFGLIRYQDGKVTKYLLDTLFGNERVYDLNTDLAENNDLSVSISPTALNEYRQELRRTFGTLIPSHDQ